MVNTDLGGAFSTLGGGGNVGKVEVVGELMRWWRLIRILLLIGGCCKVCFGIICWIHLSAISVKVKPFVSLWMYSFEKLLPQGNFIVTL